MNTEVILVNEKDEAIGTMEKIRAHEEALLHRAYSIFIFNDNGEILLHKRSSHKYHSPGLWTNTCCSHPQPGETTCESANKRLKFEMGIDAPLEKAFDFIYKAGFDNGLTEHEFDHVYVGKYNGPVEPNKDEVEDYCFKSLKEIHDSILSHPHKYTEWFKIAFPKLEDYLINNTVI